MDASRLATLDEAISAYLGWLAHYLETPGPHNEQHIQQVKRRIHQMDRERFQEMTK